jgi:hypothetical protein
MTGKPKNKDGLYSYLDSLGVLENGTEEAIKRAKREYKKRYIREYKRKERQSNCEYIVLLSKQKGEHKIISEAAAEHKSSISKFIKTAALFYLTKRYIVPDKEKVAALELILSDCRNDIKRISKNTIQPIAEKIHAMEFRLEKMESAIDALFRHPNELP